MSDEVFKIFALVFAILFIIIFICLSGSIKGCEDKQQHYYIGVPNPDMSDLKPLPFSPSQSSPAIP